MCAISPPSTSKKAIIVPFRSRLLSLETAVTAGADAGRQLFTEVLINPPTLSAGGKLFLQHLGFFSRGGSKGVVNVLAYAASLSSKQTHAHVRIPTHFHTCYQGRWQGEVSLFSPGAERVRNCITAWVYLSACLHSERAQRAANVSK